LDFVCDQLVDGPRFRILNVVDGATCERRPDAEVSSAYHRIGATANPRYAW
jgi:hypothetical protein